MSAATGRQAAEALTPVRALVDQLVGRRADSSSRSSAPAVINSTEQRRVGVSVTNEDRYSKEGSLVKTSIPFG